MDYKLILNQLMIEVTRKCNMACPHCARGKAQNINFNPNDLDFLFPYVDSIDTLSFTGGEPSLAPEILLQIFEKGKEYNVTIDRFWLKTNAKDVTDEFIKALMEMFLECENYDSYGENIPYVEISIDDGFHDEVEQKNIDKLMMFRFTKIDKRDYSKNGYKNIINEGMAKLNGYGCTELSRTDYFEVDIFDDEITFNNMFYINAKGYILNDCDYSYMSQNKNNFGHISEIEKIIEDVVLRYEEEN